MPAIYIDKHTTTGFQISACVNGNKDVFYKTREDNKFADKEPGLDCYHKPWYILDIIFFKILAWILNLNFLPLGINIFSRLFSESLGKNSLKSGRTWRTLYMADIWKTKNKLALELLMMFVVIECQQFTLIKNRPWDFKYPHVSMETKISFIWLVKIRIFSKRNRTLKKNIKSRIWCP